MIENTLLDSFQAEKLLAGSHVLTFIQKLFQELSYNSDGKEISYEDLYSSLAAEVDALPKLHLELSVPTGGEAQYSIQLTMSMEKVVDDCDRVSHKVSKFESKAREALGRLKRLHGEFGVWYALAVEQTREWIAIDKPLRLTAVQIRQLADSEYSRLINDLKLLKLEIREHKRTQMDKYSMGKDQVNASWTSHMPMFNGSNDITTEPPGRLLEPKSLLEEEALDQFEEPEVRGGGTLPTEIKGTFFKTGTPRPAHSVPSDLNEEEIT
jgi:hypothetical protein